MLSVNSLIFLTLLGLYIFFSQFLCEIYILGIFWAIDSEFGVEVINFWKFKEKFKAMYFFFK